MAVIPPGGQVIPGPEAVYRADVTLTAAEVKAARTTDVEIIAAPGTGKVVFPVSFRTIMGSTAFTSLSSRNLQLKHNSIVIAQIPASPALNANAVYDEGIDDGARAANTAVEFDHSGNALGAGSDLRIIVDYVILET